MRISTRIAVIFSLVGVLLFGGYAAHLLRKEQGELMAAIEREMNLVGRSLQYAVEHALADRRAGDVGEALDRLGEIDPTVGILIFDETQNVIAVSDGAEPSPHHAELAGGAIARQRMDLHHDTTTHAESIFLAAPLRDSGGEIIGALVVERPLLDMREDMRSTRRGLMISGALFVGVAVGLGILVGRVYIRTPLRHLKAAMNDVREGRFTSDLPVFRNDELGEVAHDFNDLAHQLNDARVRLEAELESRRELERAVRHADKLITIGQLSAGLAHEIGSPLQVLNGRARALLERHRDNDNVEKHARVIVEETDRITGIVEQLLRFARRKPARFEKTATHSISDRVRELLSQEARRKDVTLDFSNGGPSPWIEADADQLQQVVLNLVTNALIATPPGGTVKVAWEPQQSKSPDGGKRKTVRLVVEDTGHGIPPEIRERLFEPFFSTRTSEGGTGLGLAVVQSIVTEHLGSISFESETGRGTRFLVDFPAQQNPTHNPIEKNEPQW